MLSMDVVVPKISNQQTQGTEEILFKPFNGMCFLIVSIFLFPLALLLCIPCGLFELQPNTAMVLTFLGKYRGTVKQNGYFWANPFFRKRIISLRSNNLNGHELKVNDKVGNPIKISAVVVWKIKSTSKAVFDVANCTNYVTVQYEAALRDLAMTYAYEKTQENEISLRSGHEHVIHHLMTQLQTRLDRAGVEVEEARITNLAYSEEIASIMLRRQQAEAVLGAKEKIVRGAVGIVEDALHSFQTVKLNPDEQGRLASNLLIVLCSESGTQPVLTMSNHKG